MLENTEGSIKYGQSRETGNIGRRQKNTNRTQYNIGHHYIHLMNTVFTIFRIISIIKPRERKDRHLNALIKKNDPAI
jgi:hypothetical protein